MPQAPLILCSIVFSTYLLLLAAVSAQPNTHQFKLGHRPVLHRRLGSGFDNAVINATENQLFYAQKATSKNGHLGHRKEQHHHSISQEFLFAHNKVRQHFNEPLLKWDKKLARYARRWATKRSNDCKMIHSYGPYGENLFWGKRDHWTPTEAVQSWVREHKFYNSGNNECLPGEMCGHYTQVVWRDTARLGCTRKKCQNGGLFVICVYDPPGNYVNESPFGTINPTTQPLTP
ncbi:pathogenesis-related protein 1C [Juglans microcarpa x Juglans regia]|uniref:pathogenesis-related protein 1C n=1 Tax=Juglans microcarpa x Juglans regia TaxID=2249226 RepID=UPI001B7E1BD5|nr:pathogenesis-related protein 1C [Juglans microcarpa x Juglans regia]